ncbi:MAG TPA: glucose 1-dehydrogenase [Ignavibacteriaceae bacterium]|nr:glucose 1-dehydrogenase [Ignavibacteriaceae bacterium]
MINLENKIVLITGGSRGIGAACCKLFAQANAKVAFTYNKDRKAADEVAKQIGSNYWASFQIDLNDKLNMEENIDKIFEQLKDIDILVNNAGIWKGDSIDKLSLNMWEETMTVNMTSTFLFTKKAAEIMKKKRDGKIINVSSTAGQRGEAFHSDYAASKGAMISFTKAMASELGEYNINVNSVAPGWVLTDMSNWVFEDEGYKVEVIDGIPIRRIATAEDIAGPVLFLASDLARHITGEILNVNGGSVLCG